MLNLRIDCFDIVQTFNWLCVLQMRRTQNLIITKNQSLKTSCCQFLDTNDSFLLDTIPLLFGLIQILPHCSVETELSPWSSSHTCMVSINILLGISSAMIFCQILMWAQQKSRKNPKAFYPLNLNYLWLMALQVCFQYAILWNLIYSMCFIFCFSDQYV